jgi:hypothetical protein
MTAFKKLSKSNVTVAPYAANKQWNLNYCSYPTSSDYITIYKGTNVTGSFSYGDDPVTEGQYERLVYRQINHLFYQSYSSSLDTSSLLSGFNYISASQIRPTGSYFIYNDNANFVDYFPTGAMDGIRVLAINQNIFGNKVLPNYFVLTSSAYSITDDGYGNLLDNKTTYIGNLFYAHGLAVITNQDYQNMFPLPPIAKNNSESFLTTDTPKTISASLNDYARSGTLNTNSLILSGSTSGTNYSWATGSNGTIVLTTTVPGTYYVYYNIGADIAGSCNLQLRSNKAKITAVVTSPTTTTTTTTSTTTTTTTVPTTTTSTTTSTTTVPTTTTTTTSTTTSTTTVPTTTTTTSTTTTTTTAPTTTTSTTTSTTTTITGYTINLSGAGNDVETVCSTSSIIVYTPNQTKANSYDASGNLQDLVGETLYTDNTLTTPVSFTYAVGIDKRIYFINLGVVNYYTDSICP